MIKKRALCAVMLATISQAAQATFDKYSRIRFDFGEADIGLLQLGGTSTPRSEPEALISAKDSNLDRIAQRISKRDDIAEERTIFDTDTFFADTMSTKQLSFDKPFCKEKEKKDKLFDFDKPVVKPVLFIRGHGTVCDDFKVKGNVCVNGGLRFNRKGCNNLWAKGTKEKNLLNLRGVLHFDCNPFLRLSRNAVCGSDEGDVGTPAVGCITDDLVCTLGNGMVRVNSGCGFKDACASVSCSGTACLSKESVGDEILCTDISLVTTVTIEICIPIYLCVPFCDCPAVIVSHEDRAVCSRSICIAHSNNENNCEQAFRSNGVDSNIIGNNVLMFLGTDVALQSVSKKVIGIKLRMTYQQCIGHLNGETFEDEQGADIDACQLQYDAIKLMGEDANKRLRETTISVLAEGRVL